MNSATISSENRKRYQANCLQAYFVSKYGHHKTELAKVLLSHPLFDIIMKNGACVSFEMYLRRYFSIIFTIGTALSVEYWTEKGQAVFSAIDDPFCSLMSFVILIVRERLQQLKLLKPLAYGLQSIGVSRYFDQHLDNIIIEKWRNLDWEAFIDAKNGIHFRHDESEDKHYVDTTVDQLSAERGKAVENRDLYLEIEMFQKLLLRLRLIMKDGLRGSCPTFDDCQNLGLRKIKKTNLTSDLLLEEDVEVTGRLRADSEDEMLEYAEDSGKSLVFNENDDGKTFTAYFVSPVDIFKIVGSRWFDVSQLENAKYILRNFSPEQSTCPRVGSQGRPLPGIVQVDKSHQVGVLAGDHVPINVAEASQWLKQNIGRDQNSNQLLISGNSTKAKEVYGQVSARFKGRILSVIPQDFVGPVEDAIQMVAVHVKDHLNSNGLDSSDDVVYPLVAGRFVASKNNFVISGDEIHRGAVKGPTKSS